MDLEQEALARGKKPKNVKKKKKSKKNGGVEGTGFWSKFSFIGICIPSRTEVASAVITTNIPCESESAGDANRDQPLAQIDSWSTTTSTTESSSSASKFSKDLKLASRLRNYTFNELASITEDFKSEFMLGESFHKGWIDENGTAPVKPGTGLPVAVKTLYSKGPLGHKEWSAELNFLSRILHPNLVRLIGYCSDDSHRLLVYEFMPRRSLEDRLFRRSLPLPWSLRMKVVLGAAKGLAFLHEIPIIYHDFKTSKILIDADYNAKLSGFGLAKDLNVLARVLGTYGCAPPEGHLTSKSDVYSFGVVLLEILTGRRSMGRNCRDFNLVEWATPHLGEMKFYRLIDSRLEGHFSVKAAEKTAQLAYLCLSRDPEARPQMSEVVETLAPLLNLKDMASSSSFQTMQAEREAHANYLSSPESSEVSSLSD